MSVWEITPLYIKGTFLSRMATVFIIIYRLFIFLLFSPVFDSADLIVIVVPVTVRVHCSNLYIFLCLIYIYLSKLICTLR